MKISNGAKSYESLKVAPVQTSRSSRTMDDGRQSNRINQPEVVTMSAEARQVMGASADNLGETKGPDADGFLRRGIADRIKETFAKYGVDLEDAEGLDMSVDATAQRIFEGIVGLFDVYKRQNPDQSETDVVAGFERTVRAGAKAGFGEAYEIISGLNVPEATLAQARDTMDALESLLDEHFAALRQEPLSPATTETES